MDKAERIKLEQELTKLNNWMVSYPIRHINGKLELDKEMTYRQISRMKNNNPTEYERVKIKVDRYFELYDLVG